MSDAERRAALDKTVSDFMCDLMDAELERQREYSEAAQRVEKVQ